MAGQDREASGPRAAPMERVRPRTATSTVAPLGLTYPSWGGRESKVSHSAPRSASYNTGQPAPAGLWLAGQSLARVVRAESFFRGGRPAGPVDLIIRAWQSGAEQEVGEW